VVIPASYDTFYGWWTRYCERLGALAARMEAAMRSSKMTPPPDDYSDIPF
jgi:hypothetical protein